MGISIQISLAKLSPAFEPEENRCTDENEEKGKPVHNRQVYRQSLRRHEKTSDEEEQGHDTDRRDRVIPARPVRQDEGNKIEQPDRFSKGGHGIHQIDTDKDQCNDDHKTKVRCKGG